LTALLLLLASRLPGQAPSLFGNNQYGQPMVCNDGTISFSVVRALRDYKDFGFGSDQWVVQGWYNVDPGKCTEIGGREHYVGGGWFGEDSVTLLAFAFWDSTGVGGGIKVQGGDPGWFYPIYPSNQQLCVQRGAFRYTRDSPKQIDLARECDRAPAGYLLIPASFMYKGSSCAYAPNCGPDSADRLHVKLGPSDRANGVGPQGSSQTSSNTSSNAAPKPAADDNSFGAHLLKALANSIAEAGKKPISRPDAAASDAEGRAAMLKWVREDVTVYIAASANGFEAYKKGNVIVSPGHRSWVSSEAPLASKGCWVVQGDTAATFSCLLSTSTDLNGLRSYYTQLTEDVTASLPRDWTQSTAPPFGPEFPASKGYRSSSGAHGEIWIARAASGGGYELRYQLVSAVLASRPKVIPPSAVAPVDDDLIGPGGFIKPPSR